MNTRPKPRLRTRIAIFLTVIISVIELPGETCAESDAVFCYDLMNEPILPGENEQVSEWLAGEFGGKHFVQRIPLDVAGRTRTEVAQAWVRKLVAAIRKHDKHHMVTVGVIPWLEYFREKGPHH